MDIPYKTLVSSLTEQTSQVTDADFLASISGKNLLVYFYPRDNTPGCTTQGMDFSSAAKQFAKHNTAVVGISRDSLASHEKFIHKRELTIPLIADTQSLISKSFGVLKSIAAVIRLERATFYFNADGKLLHTWRKVKAAGHVKEVLVWLEENRDTIT